MFLWSNRRRSVTVLSQSVSILAAMRIEIEPARTDDRLPSPSAGDTDAADRGWSDDELARLRREWDAEPSHR